MLIYYAVLLSCQNIIYYVHVICFIVFETLVVLVAVFFCVYVDRKSVCLNAVSAGVLQQRNPKPRQQEAR